MEDGFLDTFIPRLQVKCTYIYSSTVIMNYLQQQQQQQLQL